MLVTEVPAVLTLEFVEGATELDVLDRPLRLSVELLPRPWLVAAHCLIELLEDAGIRAGRRPYQQIGGFLSHTLPRKSLVIFPIEVPAAGQVH